jgi:hypothetical protein
LNARLAPEVLFHPVGSKVSSHAFNAHFNVLDLRLGSQCAKKYQQYKTVAVHDFLLFSKMHSKLLRDSEADMAVYRHELQTRTVSDTPVGSQPNVHPRTQPDICCYPSQQNIAAGARLSDAGMAFVLGVQPSQNWADKPFT